MEGSIVSVGGLSHRYTVQWAVRDVGFEISGNGVTGLLGSNGAGKSTIMNIVCGVLNQTEGRVAIGGVDTRENPVEAKKQIGFLPQQPPLYADLTVDEYLRHAAHLRLMEPRLVRRAVDEVLERCSIARFRNRLLRNLSGGYQQRVGIAQAIIHNPPLVVLDEPTNGLDPNQIVDIRTLIREIARSHSVLLSTHILSEIQATCDNVMMIEHGRMVFSGTMEDFDDYVAPDSFVIELGNPPSCEALGAVGDNRGVEQLDGNRFRVMLASDTALTAACISRSVEQGWDLRDIRVERCSLEETFARLSGRSKTQNTEKRS